MVVLNFTDIIVDLDRDVAEELRAELLARVQIRPQDKAPDKMVVPIGRAMAGAALQWSSFIGVGLIIYFLTSPLPTAAALETVIGILPALWKEIDSS